jgi:Flp pilus assembly protein TadG
MVWGPIRSAVGLTRDRRGGTAVEFALTAPVLILLLAGLIDGSRLIVATMQVKAAAQAGADYARANGFDATSITSAVLAGTSLAVNATPAPSQETACVSGTTITVTNQSTCPGGGVSGSYAVVSAQAPFSAIMPWPGLSSPSTVSAQSIVRLQ